MSETGPNYIRSSTKRRLDVVSGIAIAGGTSPLTVATALATSIEHRKPNPLYRQPRVGRLGRLYTNYKFQSLKEGAGPAQIPGSGHEHASMLGAFVRKVGLDELPQLINVIKGDISMVGIRPLPTEHLEQYKDYVDEDLFKEWFIRYKQNPGLTGEGQLFSNRHPLHTPDVIQTRMEIDIEAFDDASLINDLATMAKTPLVLLSPSHTSGPDTVSTGQV